MLHKTKNHCFRNLPESENNFSFCEIETGFVTKQLNNLNLTKATGIDGISARLLKIASPVISESLCRLFNRSLAEADIPEEWKQAKVTPIHKEGDLDNINNYRPISVIPIVMKVFEKAIHEQVYDFLCDSGLICSQQSGFRPGYSTCTSLTYVTNYLYKQMDQGKITGIVFLDLKKAFDTVDHELLLCKLNAYGIRDAALAWFKSYLINRKQATTFRGESSVLESFEVGVPQGSILGPLLFMIYINDLPQVVSKASVMLYADDTAIMYSDSNIVNVESTLNEELDAINSWLKLNKLTLNASKTQCMTVGSPRKLTTVENIQLQIDQVPLEKVTVCKYLGIWMDENLSWHKHVQGLVSKISCRLALLRRLRGYLDSHTLKLLCNSLVLPHFEYSCPAWISGCTERLKNTLLRQHKQMARIALNVDHTISSAKIYAKLKWVPISDRWDYHISTLMYKIVNGSAPEYLCNEFSLAREVHSYRTRNAVGNNLCPPRPRTGAGKKSFHFVGTQIWNNLTPSVKHAGNLNGFKTLYWKNING